MLEHDFKIINAFIHSARQGSFTAAAQVLNLTPAAISKNVGQLEQALKVRLFSRTTRSLSLTEEGKYFFKQAETALNLLQNAAEHIRGLDVQYQGTVRISVSNVIGQALVLPCLKGLQERYPQLDIELNFEDKVIDFVKDGFDLVIRGGKIIDSSMISRDIAPLRLCLVASPDYLETQGTPRRVDDLDKHRLITRRFANGHYPVWYFRQRNVLTPYEASRYALTFSSPEACVLAAVDGSGIAEVPVYLALPYLEKGALNVLFADRHDEGNYRLVVQYAHRQLAPRVRVLMEYLMEQMSQDRRLQIARRELKQFAKT